MGVLNICHTNLSYFRIYQSIFGEYVESLKKYGTSGSGGPVVVGPNTHALYQLCIEAQEIVRMANADMRPFLIFFDIEVCH